MAFPSFGPGPCRMVLWCGSILWAQTQPCSRNCSWSWQGNVCTPAASLSLTSRRICTSSVSDTNFTDICVCCSEKCFPHIYIYIQYMLVFGILHACMQGCISVRKNTALLNHVSLCVWVLIVCCSLRHRLWWRGSIAWSRQGVCSDENCLRKGEWFFFSLVVCLNCLTKVRVGSYSAAEY